MAIPAQAGRVLTLKQAHLRWIVALVVACGAIVVFFPFFWMAVTSLKTVPVSWGNAVSFGLGRSEESVLRSAITTARVLGQVKTNAPNFTKELKQLAREAGFTRLRVHDFEDPANLYYEIRP